MDKHQQTLQRLDELNELHLWDFDIIRRRHSTEVDGYTLSIDPDGQNGYLWLLEHERYGVLMPWAHAATRAAAKTDGLCFLRAHLNAQLADQHAA